MYDQEHHSILKGSVGDWNRWRQEHRDVSPKLSGADLHATLLGGAELERADLRGADLGEAILTGSKLRGANLQGALLNGALLSRADICEANLRGAVLSDADLGRAKLRFSELERAALNGAVLAHADLSEADLRGAVLDDADLRSAQLVRANLNGASLLRAKLTEADLTGADFTNAKLNGARLERVITNDISEPNTKVLEMKSACFNRADLTDADLSEANLRGCRFVKATLCRTSLYGTNLYKANFTGAVLREAVLRYALLIETNLENCVVADCSVYGVAVWNVKTGRAVQTNLIITHPTEPTITVDKLEVAQFIHLLLHYPALREVLNTITSKIVLILGSFSPERKAVLDALRDLLRTRDYLPVLFDFDKPSSRDLTETVSTLAHLARFVIADITDARSVSHELRHIVPNLPSLPVQPLLLSSQEEYGMFEYFRKFPWVLPVYRYDSPAALLETLQEGVISPAEAKSKEIAERRRALEEEMSARGAYPDPDEETGPEPPARS